MIVVVVKLVIVKDDLKQILLTKQKAILTAWMKGVGKVQSHGPLSNGKYDKGYEVQ